MKVKKVLALILALLLVFAIGAFAQEGEGSDPARIGGGQQAGGGQEAAATQAFQRSLDVYGYWVWRYDYHQRGYEATDTHAVSSGAWNLLQAYFTYNISENLQIKFGLAWGAMWGSGRANVYYGQGFNIPDSLDALVTQEWEANSINSGSSTSVGSIAVKQVYAVWKIGGALGKIEVGRRPAYWGFNNVLNGDYAGADRFVWTGDMKAGAMRLLPLFVFEVRKDESFARNDEQLLFILGVIGIAPGKLLEQLWFYASYYMPTDRVVTSNTTFPGSEVAGMFYNQTRWDVFLTDLYVKLRIGNVLVVNVEFMFGYGSFGRFLDKNQVDLGYHIDDVGKTAIKWQFFATLVNLEANLGLIQLTLDLGFVSAPPNDYDKGDTGHFGWKFFSYNYIVGGRLMNDIYGNNGGFLEGVIVAALTAKFNLMGGKLVPWVKLAYSMSATGYYNTGLAYTDVDNNRAYGFEFDLGVYIQLADGFTFGIEGDFWLIGSRISEGQSILTGLVAYDGLALGIYMTLDLKF